MSSLQRATFGRKRNFFAQITQGVKLCWGTGGAPRRGREKTSENSLPHAPTICTLSLELSSLERATFDRKRNFGEFIRIQKWSHFVQKTFFGNVIFSGARDRGPPPTGKVWWKSDDQFLSNLGSNFANSTPLKIFSGEMGEGGWGHPRRTSGLSIPSRRKLSPTTPCIFRGHLKIVQNLTQIWGTVEVPITGGYRSKPLPNNGDTSPTERNWNCIAEAPRYHGKFPPDLPLQFSVKKKIL